MLTKLPSLPKNCLLKSFSTILGRNKTDSVRGSQIVRWVVYYLHQTEDEGVAIMMTKDIRKALTAWKNISSYLTFTTFTAKNRRVKTHKIQFYASTYR